MNDPTELGRERAGVRPSDHGRRRHGAAVDSEALRAFDRACAKRREEALTTALRFGGRRCYTREEHARAEELRREALVLHGLADSKKVPAQRAGVRQEAVKLEEQADQIVPAEYARPVA